MESYIKNRLSEFRPKKTTKFHFNEYMSESIGKEAYYINEVLVEIYEYKNGSDAEKELKKIEGRKIDKITFLKGVTGCYIFLIHSDRDSKKLAGNIATAIAGEE